MNLSRRHYIFLLVCIIVLGAFFILYFQIKPRADTLDPSESQYPSPNNMALSGLVLAREGDLVTNGNGLVRYPASCPVGAVVALYNDENSAASVVTNTNSRCEYFAYGLAGENRIICAAATRAEIPNTVAELSADARNRCKTKNFNKYEDNITDLGLTGTSSGNGTILRLTIKITETKGRGPVDYVFGLTCPSLALTNPSSGGTIHLDGSGVGERLFEWRVSQINGTQANCEGTLTTSLLGVFDRKSFILTVGQDNRAEFSVDDDAINFQGRREGRIYYHITIAPSYDTPTADLTISERCTNGISLSPYRRTGIPRGQQILQRSAIAAITNGSASCDVQIYSQANSTRSLWRETIAVQASQALDKYITLTTSRVQKVSWLELFKPLFPNASAQVPTEYTIKRPTTKKRNSSEEKEKNAARIDGTVQGVPEHSTLELQFEPQFTPTNNVTGAEESREIMATGNISNKFSVKPEKIIINQNNDFIIKLREADSQRFTIEKVLYNGQEMSNNRVTLHKDLKSSTVDSPYQILSGLTIIVRSNDQSSPSPSPSPTSGLSVKVEWKKYHWSSPTGGTLELEEPKPLKGAKIKFSCPRVTKTTDNNGVASLSDEETRNCSGSVQAEIDEQEDDKQATTYPFFFKQRSVGLSNTGNNQLTGILPVVGGFIIRGDTGGPPEIVRSVCLGLDDTVIQTKQEELTSAECGITNTMVTSFSQTGAPKLLGAGDTTIQDGSTNEKGLYLIHVAAGDILTHQNSWLLTVRNCKDAFHVFTPNPLTLKRDGPNYANATEILNPYP